MCRFSLSVLKYALFLILFAKGEATLAGGRPNAFSGGINAFAGVVNPANAVWVEDRVDVGVFCIHQHSSLNNRDNNSRFLPGKTNLTYRASNIWTGDLAIHKRCDFWSLTFAAYTTPNSTELRTKHPIPSVGTTPVHTAHQVQVFSTIFSIKYTESQSFGLSLDYFSFSQLRNGFQRSDNPLRSVSPGNVTNNGTDHSGGFGLTLGWRWNITEQLNFGIAFAKKSYCGQFQRYRGYEPHRAKNYVPATLGAGFTYHFTKKLSGRLEVLWTDLGNLPSANNNVLPNGQLNLNKRGSRCSPGPGTQDATYINCGIGYLFTPELAAGVGYSHRIKLHQRKSNFLSHTYVSQVTYDLISLGVNFNCHRHNLFFSTSFGLPNKLNRNLPPQLGNGRITTNRQIISFSASWGYRY